MLIVTTSDNSSNIFLRTSSGFFSSPEDKYETGGMPKGRVKWMNGWCDWYCFNWKLIIGCTRVFQRTSSGFFASPEDKWMFLGSSGKCNNGWHLFKKCNQWIMNECLLTVGLFLSCPQDFSRVLRTNGCFLRTNWLMLVLNYSMYIGCMSTFQ